MTDSAPNTLTSETVATDVTAMGYSAINFATDMSDCLLIGDRDYLRFMGMVADSEADARAKGFMAGQRFLLPDGSIKTLGA